MAQRHVEAFTGALCPPQQTCCMIAASACTQHACMETHCDSGL